MKIGRYPEIKVRAYDLKGRKVSKRYLDFAKTGPGNNYVLLIDITVIEVSYGNL